MVKIPLTQGKFALVDKDMEFLKQYRWYYENNSWSGYARRAINQVPVRMHHVIIGHPLNKLMVDHINGNGLDNRRKNLRLVDGYGNAGNMKIHRKGKLVGARWNKVNKNWFARMRLKGKFVYLGTFATEQEAHLCYQQALDRVRGK